MRNINPSNGGSDVFGVGAMTPSVIDPDFLRFLIAERAEQIKVAPLHEVARLTKESNRAAALLAEIEND